MANFYGMARSNYVPMKPDVVKALTLVFGIRTHEKDGKTCILSDSGDGYPMGYVDFGDPEIDAAYALLGLTEEDDGADLELFVFLPLAFADTMDELFVWQEIGHENMRFISAYAMAMDRNGTVVKTINLNDINDLDGVKNPAEY